MEIFQDYAYYYNLFYGDKNYEQEARDIYGLIQNYGQGLENGEYNVLNLGCGTGRHDYELGKLGWKMTGIDMSAQMIEIADSLKDGIAEKLSFEVSDIRKYEPLQIYDAVISLFHVISYQNDNRDVLSAFATAYKALRPGGIFLFDVWYGPGVLSDKPVVRVKQIEDEKNIIIRTARPVMYAETDVVDVCYDVYIIDKQTSVTKQIKETHSMRYFFAPELKMMLEQSGFEVLDVLDCVSLKDTNYNSWTAYFIARKR